MCLLDTDSYKETLVDSIHWAVFFVSNEGTVIEVSFFRDRNEFSCRKNNCALWLPLYAKQLLSRLCRESTQLQTSVFPLFNTVSPMPSNQSMVVNYFTQL